MQKKEEIGQKLQIRGLSDLLNSVLYPVSILGLHVATATWNFVMRFFASVVKFLVDQN